MINENFKENFRKRRAALWGSDDPDDTDIRHKIVETLRPPGVDSDSNMIRLFVFRERWGYCLRLMVGNSYNAAGVGYGPLFSFCDPHATRYEALYAASVEVFKYCKHSDPHSKFIAEWARSLVVPKQLKLI